MSRAGGLLFASGLAVSLGAMFLPWGGADWRIYVIMKWTVAGLGLLTVLIGALLIYRRASSESDSRPKALHVLLKYMSLSGAVISFAMIFLSSWYQDIILLFGVALNVIVLTVTLRGKEFSRFPLILLAALLWVSFIAVILWNFIETLLPNLFL